MTSTFEQAEEQLQNGISRHADFINFVGGQPSDRRIDRAYDRILNVAMAINRRLVRPVVYSLLGAPDEVGPRPRNFTLVDPDAEPVTPRFDPYVVEHVTLRDEFRPKAKPADYFEKFYDQAQRELDDETN